LTAISLRNLERFADAIVTALRSDASAPVRSQIVALLIRHAEMPGAAEAVAWARDDDPDPGVRAAAQRDGTCANVQNGRRVEVEGALQGDGTLLATEVDFD